MYGIRGDRKRVIVIKVMGVGSKEHRSLRKCTWKYCNGFDLAGIIFELHLTNVVEAGISRLWNGLDLH